LGPSKELLQKKREERETERKRIRDTNSNRRRTTDEERAKALQEMQMNARKREETMARQALHKPSSHDDEAPSKGNASFLSDITKQTHGIISGSGSARSLSARVAQNRHTNQRLHDSFL
jgi:beta-phosphoglucomutase-like phosphatase (HAD superfamily)